jgi:hypothetical protein
MSAFLDAISQNPVEIKLTRALAKNPFRNVIAYEGGATELFKFHCDSIFVKPESLKKLRKYVKFVPFGELSPRLSSRAYFTIACVCKIKGDLLFVSDLRTAKRVLHAPQRPVIRPFDIIGIANAVVGDDLKTTSENQIIRIGRCETVVKCGHSEPDERCSIFIDSRNGVSCEYHCTTAFKQAGTSRMLLKQNTRMMTTESPASSPDRAGILQRRPLEEVPQPVIDQYLDLHATGRGAKFTKVLRPKEGPKIGAGLAQGDTITF